MSGMVKGRNWSEQQISTAAAMLKRGASYAAIAKEIGRSRKAVATRATTFGPTFKSVRTLRVQAQDHGNREPPNLTALADRDRRAALAPRNLTAAIFGDPLPGCSALDQRRS